MDHRLNVSINSPEKPSKILALIAMIIAFALPFIFVKLFPHKPRSNYTKHQHNLPAINNRISFKNHMDTISKDRQANEERSNNGSATQKPKTLLKTNNVLAKKQVVSNNGWKIVKTLNGDSLALVFKRVGISAKILHTIMSENSHVKTWSKLSTNQKLKFLLKNGSLEKLILPYSNTQYLVVYKFGSHYKIKIKNRKMTSQNKIIAVTIRGSLYQTAKRNIIPSKLIQQMTDIFTWDINFGKDVRSGDQFKIIYKAFYIKNKQVDTGDILAVSFTNHGHTYQAIRHTNRYGQSNYYTALGASLKKAFSRYPIKFSHISSTFSLSRYHPILHYRRPHKGIDLAARIGTPIQATGDGRIEIIGRQSDYGNMIKIKHNKTYSTIYGHMLKFQKGLSKGDYVHRGQIIGYVGQTGLASGPHCHYEFHINNQPRNPTTVDLPKGDPVSRRELAAFKANTSKLLAQMNGSKNIQLAKKHG